MVGATMGLSSGLKGCDVDFSFTEEQLMIQDVARRIAQEKIAPSAEQFDRSGEFRSKISACWAKTA